MLVVGVDILAVVCVGSTVLVDFGGEGPRGEADAMVVGRSLGGIRTHMYISIHRLHRCESTSKLKVVNYREAMTGKNKENSPYTIGGTV